MQAERKRKFITRIALAAAGLALLIAGLYQGEYQVVLNKAIHICLECIGIG